jgi:hypothetical protein
MYKQFAFEGDVHASLDCVPLTVRRKLDLAGMKISLAGWQTLSRPERLALCHLPVDAAAELGVYREVMSGFCAARAIPVTPLAVPAPDALPWRTAVVPTPLAERARMLGAILDQPRWGLLDEESRYALWKLAEPKGSDVKLGAALGELALLPNGATAS